MKWFYSADNSKDFIVGYIMGVYSALVLILTFYQILSR